MRVGLHQASLYPCLIQQVPHNPALRVIADNSGQQDLDIQSPQQSRDGSGSAEPDIAGFRLHHEHRRLGADPLRPSPGVLVQHEIAEDQHAPRPRQLG
jgi:hypothetical protein